MSEKKLVVMALVDIMSSRVYEYDVELEYADMQKFLEDELGVSIYFKKDVPPHMLENMSFDLYVFDYGGMLPGSETLTESLYRSFIQQAEEHPSAAFLIYSTFSCVWYNETIRNEMGTDAKPANVFLFKDENWIEDIKIWLGLTPNKKE